MALDVVSMAQAAKSASRVLAKLRTAEKDHALEAMAQALESNKEALLAANQKDLAPAEVAAERGEFSRSALNRLKLSEDKISQMVASIRSVASLPDPAGRLLSKTLLDDGLVLHKITCPFGVIAAVVEARPDALAQISALAIKSGNALMIKSGSEAEHTATLLMELFRSSLKEQTPIPEDALVLVQGREAVKELLAQDKYVDLVVPRGSNQLVQFVHANTRIPVLGHADGVCHIYVDNAADLASACDIIVDAKVTYPSACNAVETVLLHSDIAAQFLPELVRRLQSEKVTVRGCERAREIVSDLEPVADDEWHTEYGDLVLAVRVVDGLSEAITHINQYGSAHTDSILTADQAAAERFLDEVDSAGVYHNVSTRFSDGYRYGFGAEVGISTNKIHARGPVGLEALATYKYKLYGNGQLVSTYSGKNARPFKHEQLL